MYKNKLVLKVGSCFELRFFKIQYLIIKKYFFIFLSVQKDEAEKTRR